MVVIAGFFMHSLELYLTDALLFDQQSHGFRLHRCGPKLLADVELGHDCQCFDDGTHGPGVLAYRETLLQFVLLVC